MDALEYFGLSDEERFEVRRDLYTRWWNGYERPDLFPEDAALAKAVNAFLLWQFTQERLAGEPVPTDTWS